MVLSWADRAGQLALRVDAGDAAESDTQAFADLTAGRLAVLPEASVVAGQASRALQPMAGVWSRADRGWMFSPRFRFVPGLTYVVLLDGVRQGALTSLAPEDHPTTVVIACYPAVAEVPLNLLKVYVHFSAPMEEGHARRFVRVTQTDTGMSRRDVFLEMTPELWDATRTRLTLLLDPARIKRGLVPHEEGGYPLTEGEPVTITIDPSWPDATGQPLKAGWSQHYRVGAAVRARVRPEQWQVEAPAAGTLDPLTVRFDRPLDHALLTTCLHVLAHEPPVSAVALSGEGLVDAEGLSWRFTPAVPWRAGAYEVQVEGRLEDLAGNSVVRVFDRDLDRRLDDPVEATHASITWVPHSPGS